MSDAFRLDGERALITGGGSGIGLGMARAFVQSGARVVLVGRRENQLHKAVAELGASSSYVAHDITQMDRAGQLVKRAEAAAAGPISILVNNAGIHLKKPAEQTTPAEFNSVLQTHVVAAHALTLAVLPGMVRSKYGCVLFTSSMTAFLGVPQVIAYSAAKSAYLGMVRTLATEMGRHGIRVNAIAPGWIDTDMWLKVKQADPRRAQRILARTPPGRFGQPDDIGFAAVFLCSAAAKFITGAVLPVDGGVSIGL